jgi:hypothetical protein
VSALSFLDEIYQPIYCWREFHLETSIQFQDLNAISTPQSKGAKSAKKGRKGKRDLNENP